MKKVKITFSDGTSKEYELGTTFERISKDFPGKYPYVGVEIDNVVFSLDEKPEEDVTVKFIDFTDTIGQKIYKCGVEFIFEVAIKKLYPNFEVYFLHSHPKGVFLEVKGSHILSDEEVINIKSMMSKIVSDNLPIKKLNITKKDAVKYCKEHGFYEKAENIQNFSEGVVTIYTLDNHANNFYSQLPNKTGAMNQYGVKYLNDNKFVLLLPNKFTSGRVPEYVSYKKITDSFEDSEKWLGILNKSFICDLNDDISNCKIKDFINLSEIKFNDDIRGVVKEISDNVNVKFVMIAGPSSSGKTTTTKRLKTYLDCCGYHTIVISTDDYFVDRKYNPKDENGNYDYECLHAVNIEKLNKDLRDLIEGKEVELPVYDFVSGTGTNSGTKVKFTNRSIVLIEGLHSLNDDLIPIIDNKYKYKVYISPFIGVNIDRHNYISTTDLRLIRRIVRDNRVRGKSAENTISYWQNVRNGEVKYIFPYIHQANTIINTALNFELGVLKVYAEPLLLSIKMDSIYYEEARRLINFLKDFCPIPSEYVSKDSILREFIGGE